MKISFGELVVRTLMTMLVVWLTAKLTPWFTIDKGFKSLLLASLIIALVQYFVVQGLGLGQSPAGQGGVGFLVTVLILYVSGKLAPSIHINLLGSLIGAFFIGIVDALIPGKRF